MLHLATKIFSFIYQNQPQKPLNQFVTVYMTYDSVLQNATQAFQQTSPLLRLKKGWQQAAVIWNKLV
jgi:hypothetical protein